MIKDRLLPGQKILHYVITEKIGKGGMGEVYKAFDGKLNRSVALKVLNLPNEIDQVEWAKRFLSEARILAKLNHPCFPTVFEIEEEPGFSFFAMEYLEGYTLKDFAMESNFSFDKLIRIIKDVALGLNYLHEQAIYHRDVKPSNLFITNTNELKILDLGIAKWHANPEEQETQVYQILGSLMYCPPEILDFQKFTVRSEIYSMVLTMVNIILGAPLYDGNSNEEIIKNVRFKHAIFPEPINRNLPSPLRDFLIRSLEKDPRDRYEGMHEVISVLDSLLEVLSKEFLSLPVYKIRDEKLHIDNKFLRKDYKKDHNIYTLTLFTGAPKLDKKEYEKKKHKKSVKKKRVEKNVKKFNISWSWVGLFLIIFMGVSSFLESDTPFINDSLPKVETLSNDISMLSIKNEIVLDKEDVIQNDSNLLKLKILLEEEGDSALLKELVETENLLLKADVQEIKVPFTRDLVNGLVFKFERGEREKVYRSLKLANRVLKRKVVIEEDKRTPASDE
jgi:serine/threonine protein kinase